MPVVVLDRGPVDDRERRVEAQATLAVPVVEIGGDDLVEEAAPGQVDPLGPAGDRHRLVDLGVGLEELAEFLADEPDEVGPRVPSPEVADHRLADERVAQVLDHVDGDDPPARRGGPEPAVARRHPRILPEERPERPPPMEPAPEPPRRRPSDPPEEPCRLPGQACPDREQQAAHPAIGRPEQALPGADGQHRQGQAAAPLVEVPEDRRPHQLAAPAVQPVGVDGAQALSAAPEEPAGQRQRGRRPRDPAGLRRRPDHVAEPADHRHVHRLAEQPLGLAGRDPQRVVLLLEAATRRELRRAPPPADQGPRQHVDDVAGPSGAGPEVEVVGGVQRGGVAAERLERLPPHRHAGVPDRAPPAELPVDHRGQGLHGRAPDEGAVARDDPPPAVDERHPARQDRHLRMRLEVLDLRGEPPGLGDVVAVEDRDVPPACDRQAAVPRPLGAEVRLVPQRDEPIVPIGADDRRRVVGRGVIDDDQLEIAVRLRQHTLDRSPEIGLAVVDGHEDRDGRIRVHGRRGWVSLRGSRLNGADA